MHWTYVPSLPFRNQVVLQRHMAAVLFYNLCHHTRPAVLAHEAELGCKACTWHPAGVNTSNQPRQATESVELMPSPHAMYHPYSGMQHKT